MGPLPMGYYGLSNKDPKNINVFAHDLTMLKGVFCFPPIPVKWMILKYLEQQQVDCVMNVPATYSPWVNLVSLYMVDLMEVSTAYDH